MATLHVLKDSFQNLLAGFGLYGQDKAASQRFVLKLMDPVEVEAAYRSDWLARKIVDIPAVDSCRAWREWHAEADQIEQIEKTEKRLGVQRKLMHAMTKARLYGGAAMVIGVEGQKFDEELDPETVGKDQLVFLHVVSRWELAAGDLVKDLTSPWYGEPSYYRRDNSVVISSEQLKTPLEQSGLGYEPGSVLIIHPSRVVRLVGLDYPQVYQSPDSWGDSALQPVVDAIKAAGLVSSSICAMIAEAKLDVVKVPGLIDMISTREGTEKIRERFGFSMTAKSVINTTLIDSNEEWERINLTFSNMDKVMSMYLMIAAGAADIPATRLLGREPAGMNATGDSDIRNYYDRLQSDQAMRVQPALARLDEVVIRSALGSRPEEIYYDWKPLWQMDDEQKSNVWLKKAQAFQVDVNSGLINPDALREARINQCVEDGLYPGLAQAVEEHGEEPEEDEHDELDLLMKKQELELMKQPQPQPQGRNGNGGKSANGSMR